MISVTAWRQASTQSLSSSSILVIILIQSTCFRKQQICTILCTHGKTPFTLPHEAYLWSAPLDYLGEAVQRYSTLLRLVLCVVWRHKRSESGLQSEAHWHPVENPLYCHSNGIVYSCWGGKCTQCEDKQSIPLDRSSRLVLRRPIQRYSSFGSVNGV